MAENENKNIDPQFNVDTNQMYIDTINELKANSVSKADYDKVVNENRNLLKSLVQGNPMSTDKDETPKRTADEIRADLFGKDHTNLEFAQEALELRDTIIANGGTDPFLPVGKDIIVTDSDVASANRVAEALKQCIEYADGNSDIFTNELQRIMVDSAPIRRR